MIDKDRAVKRTDLSVFKNKGTAIPVPVRFFFGAENFTRGQQQLVTLVMDGTEYPARLGKIDSEANQVRLMWNTSLSQAFNRKYPRALADRRYPTLIFRKIDSSHYELEFDRPLTEIVKDDLRTEDLETAVGVEGSAKRVYGKRYERDPRLREAAIRIHGVKCAVCGFDFEAMYGAVGRDFIEVHHRVPLSEKNGEAEVNPRTDLVCVCSNCHRMLHRVPGNVFMVEELREMLRETGSLQEIDGQLVMSRKFTVNKYE